MVYIARRFENTGINIEDLISIGTIGLINLQLGDGGGKELPVYVILDGPHDGIGIGAQHVAEKELVAVPVGVEGFVQADLSPLGGVFPEIHEDLVLNAPGGVGGQLDVLVRPVGIGRPGPWGPSPWPSRPLPSPMAAATPPSGAETQERGRRAMPRKALALLRRLLESLGLLRPGKIQYIGGSDTLPPPLSREEEAEVPALQFRPVRLEAEEEPAADPHRAVGQETEAAPQTFQTAGGALPLFYLLSCSLAGALVAGARLLRERGAALAGLDWRIFFLAGGGCFLLLSVRGVQGRGVGRAVEQEDRIKINHHGRNPLWTGTV